MSLFGRSVLLEVGPEGLPGLRLGPLRVAFRVQHKAQGNPATATIRIYNPAPTTEDLIRQPGNSVRLLAGYGGLPRLMFQGTPVRDGIKARTQGTDRILTVEGADGGRGYTDTFFNLSYPGPTTYGQVLAQILVETGWARGSIALVEALTFPAGLVLQGRPAEVLDRLAATVPPAGAVWQVRDGALYVTPKGQPTPEVAPVLSAELGNLVGWPTQGTDSVTVTALLDATMRPGRSFQVLSKRISGIYVARDVTFRGDSKEGRFDMVLTGKPLGVA